MTSTNNTINTTHLTNHNMTPTWSTHAHSQQNLETTIQIWSQPCINPIEPGCTRHHTPIGKPTTDWETKELKKHLTQEGAWKNDYDRNNDTLHNHECANHTVRTATINRNMISTNDATNTTHLANHNMTLVQLTHAHLLQASETTIRIWRQPCTNSMELGYNHHHTPIDKPATD